jgi:hypothetical protein
MKMKRQDDQSGTLASFDYLQATVTTAHTV